MGQLDLQLFGSDLYITDGFDAAIQELDILFNTEETELIGNYKYGTNFEQFLWTLKPQSNEVRRYVANKIYTQTCFCRNYITSIDCEIVEGTLRDIYLIKIELKQSNGDKIMKTYTLK